MHTRTFGRTGWQVSEIGFGGWGIGGGAWGRADDSESMAALHAALDAGITFFDTADVYGDGRSERLIRRLRRERSEPFHVATKAGRRLSPHVAAGYTAENIAAFVDRSLANLDVERIDLLQLHCPPTEVYYRPEMFEALDDLVTAGKIAFYGVSVEKVEEALKAIEYPNVQSVQIIFNAFRLRPTELFFEQALRRHVAACQRDAVGLPHPRHHVPRRRPPHLQPRGGRVRQGRNLFGGTLREGTRGGRTAEALCASWIDARAVRAPLDSCL
jgi:aryl-alcohol dehydrogenase-like predicted oxidoreductase